MLSENQWIKRQPCVQKSTYYDFVNLFTFELETSKCFKVNIISFKQYVSQPGFAVHTADFHSVGLNINLPAALSANPTGERKACDINYESVDALQALCLLGL